MELKPGLKLRSTTDTTEVVVVRAGTGSVTITCGGAPMILPGDPVAAAGVQNGHEGPTQLGKRYTDDEAGVELLCTKSGDGGLACEGRALTLKTAKPLPSSD